MRVLRTGSRLGQSTSERRRAIGSTSRSVARSRAGGVDRPAAARPDAADDDDEDGQRALEHPRDHWTHRPIEPALDDMVLENHLPGHPPEDGRAEVDNPPESGHEARQETAPPDD